MKWHKRVLVAGVIALALGLSAFVVGRGLAAGRADGDAKGSIQKIADALEKGDESAAKKEADDLAKKSELDEVMVFFALRTKKGFGLGDKPGAITPDGIEAKLIALGKKPLMPKALEKEGPAIAKAAYQSAAIAEISLRKTPEKKQGNKDPKDWEAWSKDMKTASLDVAKAALAKDAKGLKDAASKLNSSCNNCHGVFRD